jgi:predicted Fe-S protein YdhL (DUF1289 family)
MLSPMTDFTPPADFPASPCINVCRMDPQSGLCLGCARTLDEIARWAQSSIPERRRVLGQLPQRRAELGWPETGEAFA